MSSNAKRPVYLVALPMGEAYEDEDGNSHQPIVLIDTKLTRRAADIEAARHLGAITVKRFMTD